MAAQLLQFTPMALQALPVLVETVMKLVEAAKRDPTASEPDNKARLDAIDARLHGNVNALDSIVLPKRQVV